MQKLWAILADHIIFCVTSSQMNESFTVLEQRIHLFSNAQVCFVPKKLEKLYLVWHDYYLGLPKIPSINMSKKNVQKKTTDFLLREVKIITHEKTTRFIIWQNFRYNIFFIIDVVTIHSLKNMRGQTLCLIFWCVGVSVGD